MRKLFYVIAAIALVGVFVFFLFFFRKSPATYLPSPQIRGVLPAVQIAGSSTAPARETPTGETITIGTSHGSVTMRNLYKAAVDTEEGFLILKDSDDYKLQYDPASGEFSIYVFRAPFNDVRKKAEEELLALLNVSLEAACRLTVSVGAFPNVEGSAAGTTFGLSFCPSSIQFNQ